MTHSIMLAGAFGFLVVLCFTWAREMPPVMRLVIYLSTVLVGAVATLALFIDLMVLGAF